MKRISIKNRILILIVIFIVALLGYFVVSQRNNSQDEIIYTSVDEPELPVIWVDMCDRQMNCLRGYTSPVGKQVTYDTLTLLPDDRKLSIHTAESKYRITGVSYEIRDISLGELIEQTEVTDYTSSETGYDITLPIQNLLKENVEYILDITLKTEEKGDVHYYSRIMNTDSALADEMIALSTAFSIKNFDYNNARDNTTYLETDETGDNTSLGFVNLKSNYDQLTYNALGLDMEGTADVRLVMYDTNMGEVSISFMAGRETEDGSNELYEVRESYILRMGAERLYMMDYSRHMNEVFMGDRAAYAAKRIVLGISEDDRVSASQSPDHSKTAWVSDRDLWMYDAKKSDAIKVYSFRSGTDSGIRSNYNRHDSRIMKIEDSGDITFITYGYMNRGRHEGSTGISLMKYVASDKVITEITYIPVALTYEEIEKDMNALAYLGDNGMFYIKLGSYIYGMDISSHEYIAVADNLRDGTYAISPLMKRIAWQDTNDAYGSDIVHFMDLDTGMKKEVRTEEGKIIKPEGFIDLDLIISIADKSDEWMMHGLSYDLPATAIEIIDDNLVSQKHYEKNGYYLNGIEVSNSRIHLNLLQKTGDQIYENAGDDTIVCNEELESDDLAGIGFYASEDKRKVYFVQLDHSIGNERIDVSTPTDINYDSAAVLNLNIGDNPGERFVAYGRGNLIGSYDSMGEAVDAAYNHMGRVSYQGIRVYMRAATVSARTLRDYASKAQEIEELHEAGELTLLRGNSLKEVLYYVSTGYPVFCYDEAGEPILIYGYDRYNISVYRISTGETYKAGIEDSQEMFAGLHADFFCNYRYK